MSLTLCRVFLLFTLLLNLVPSFSWAADRESISLVGDYVGRATRFVTLGEVHVTSPCQVKIRKSEKLFGVQFLKVEASVDGENFIHSVKEATIQSKMNMVLGTDGFGSVWDKISLSIPATIFESHIRKLEMVFRAWNLDEVSIKLTHSEVFVTNETGLRCDNLRKLN